MRGRTQIVLVLGTAVLVGCENAPPVREFKSSAAMVDVTQTAFQPEPKVVGWPGLALFDYDNDDDIDVFVTNQYGLPNMFYENDGTGQFTFVGNRARLLLLEESCVAAGVGDFDNDGWLDLIVSCQPFFAGPLEGGNQLFYMKNMGPEEDGLVRFEDRTEGTGLEGVTHGSSLGVGDIDNDGQLDLYVGRYNLLDLDFRTISYLPDTPNRLFHQTRVEDGVPVFEDITESAGVAGTRVAGFAPDTQHMVNHMPTWAVYMSDVNEDGLIDIFSLQEIPGGVDLFINNGDLTFTLTHEDLLNKYGGWMGITGGDYDRDGDVDYFLANVGADAKGPGMAYHIADAWKLPNGSPFHRLLRNDGNGAVTDVAPETVVEPGVLPPTNIVGGRGLAAYEFGFGCAWFDIQNDGWIDLHWIGEIVLSGVVPNGAFRRDFHGVGRFLSSNGDGSFTDRTAERGLFNWDDSDPLEYGYSHPGRALAAVDLNGDGFADICRTNGYLVPVPDKAFTCFMNPAAERGHWITIRLDGTESNRFGIGAKVRAVAGDATFFGEVVTTTSSFTAVHPQVHFGLGDRVVIDELSVHWPSGRTSTVANIPVDQIFTVTE